MEDRRASPTEETEETEQIKETEEIGDRVDGGNLGIVRVSVT